MAVHGCVGYTSGCRCPRCRRRRREREHRAHQGQHPQARRRAPARVPVTDHPPEPRGSQPAYRSGHTGLLAGLGGNRHEHALIAHLCQQIAALRHIAAQHSPGDPSVQLQRQHTRQLVEILEHQRAQLRALLGGDVSDTEQHDSN
ncbi:hypothetical protein [Mycobacteroides abscessus]|uniref:hypothetical protein n=1 Tax=Mycobacteroides abscessus TaxID=36809 RepID=UPI00130014C7|nr:hypothetical protein [Mycobacteroides abscessus]